jgi:hypothetical protein
MNAFLSSLDAKDLLIMILGTSLGSAILTKAADFVTAGLLSRIKPGVGVVIDAVYSKVEDGRLTQEEAKELVKAAIARYL